MNDRQPMPPLPARRTAWSYWVACLAGLFLVFSSSMFGFTDQQPAFWTSAILGVAITLVAFWGGLSRRPAPWKRAVVVALGLLAMAAPFVLGESSHQRVLFSMVILGAIAAISAGVGLIVRPANPAA